ncbi:MAG: hypothetical protein AMXMBFR7_20110 [Planctomycetota bacterium]
MLLGAEAQTERTNPAHAHNLHELVICLSGRGEQHIAGCVHPFVPGKLFLLPEHSVHWVAGTPRHPARLVYVCFDTRHFAHAGPPGMQERVQRLIREERFVCDPGPEARRRCLELAARLSEEFKREHELRQELVHCHLTELLVIYQRGLDLREPRAHPYRSAIEKLAIHLADNLDDPPSLPQAAKQAGMSRALFARVFKELTGHTYVEHLQIARIQRACELLAATERAVTAVALDAGFKHFGHFHALFKRQLNMTPRAYRQWVRQRGPFVPILKIRSLNS